MQFSIEELRPNNWYLNQDKVDSLRKKVAECGFGSLPPILIAEIDGQLAIIDGHTRAFIAFENGFEKIEGYLKPVDEIDEFSDLYIYLHRNGPDNGVQKIEDLKARILSSSEFQVEWIQFCQNLTSLNVPKVR